MDLQQETSFKKRIIPIIESAVAIIIIVVAVLYFSGKSTTKKENKINADAQFKKEQVLERESIINDIVKGNNALKDWSKNTYSTIQLQEKIIDKPVLYIGTINDIFLKEDKTYIKLDSSYPEDISYTLELECNKQLVDKIRTRSVEKDFTNGIGDDYAVVAQVKNITKASVKLTAELDDEYKYVDFDSSGSELYMGDGKCIDLVYLKDVKMY